MLCFSLVMLCYVMLSTETTTGFKLLEYFDLQRYPAQMSTVCFTLTDCFKDRLIREKRAGQSVVELLNFVFWLEE